MRTKKNFLIAATALLLFAASSQAQVTTDSPEKTSIQNILQDETNTWNEGNAAGYSKYFAPDGTFTNILGMFYTGKEEFQKRHVQIFNGMFKGTQMKQKLVSLKFVRQDVAIAETITWISGFSPNTLPPSLQPDAKGRLRTRLLQVLVKEANTWKIVSYHNVEVSPAVPTPEPE